MYLRAFEVRNLPGHLQRRGFRCQLQSLDLGLVVPEAELQIRLRGNVAKVLIFRVHLADLNAAVIALGEAIVGHRRNHLVDAEVERELVLVQQQHAIVHIDACDGEIE